MRLLKRLIPFLLPFMLLTGCVRTVYVPPGTPVRLRETIRNYKFVWEERTFRLGCSIGVVPITGDSGDVAALLSAAEIILINEVAREQALSRVLRPVVDDYDLIIIDCQPSLGLLTVNALTAAHGVFIPLEAEYFAMRGVALLTEQIERVQDRLNPRLQLDGVLLTMVDMRTLHSREVMSSVRQGFGDKVYDTYISRTVKFPDATIAAQPITEYAPSHAAAEAYRHLAREVIAKGQCA